MKRLIWTFVGGSLLWIPTVVLGQQSEVIASSTFIPELPFPIAIEAHSNGDLDMFYSQNVNLNTSGGQLPGGVVKVKKGRGVATIIAGSGSSLSLAGSGINLSISENQSVPIPHGGNLGSTEVWSTGSINLVTADLQINAGDTLTIEDGCWVVLDSAVNIVVEGMLQINGTRENPVSFISSAQSHGWGGIICNSGVATAKYSLFVNGGSDSEHLFGHSDSQAIVMSNNGNVSMDRCYIFDSAGKGIGSEQGVITFSNGVISRCDMGGEFVASSVQIRSTHIMDIPNDDGVFEDDDNDGLYFSGTHPSIIQPSIVDSTVLVIGKDDGIDHNGAVLEIKNSWIEGFENEGVAASNTNSVLVYNTLVKDCAQGIEAGYGTPQVTVNHCVLIQNDYGLRFGDWYDWGSNGSIECTNSIMHDNVDNLHNFDVLSNGPVSNAMNVAYCLTNDVEYDGNTGCLSGIPLVTSMYLLENSSPGWNAGNDGMDMGLIAPLSTTIEVNDLPTDLGEIYLILVYDLNGRLVTSVQDPEKKSAVLNRLVAGAYIVSEYYERHVVSCKHLVFK